MDSEEVLLLNSEFVDDDLERELLLGMQTNKGTSRPREK